MSRMPIKKIEGINPVKIRSGECFLPEIAEQTAPSSPYSTMGLPRGVTGASQGGGLDSSAARFGETAPVARAETDPAKLAGLLEAEARRRPNGGLELLMKVPSKVAAQALLLIPNDVNIAQLIVGLESISPNGFIEEVFFWMDLLDPSVEGGANTRDRTRCLIENIIIDKGLKAHEEVSLKCQALMVLAMHVERYGWFNLFRLIGGHESFVITGIISGVSETGEEFPFLINVHKSYGASAAYGSREFASPAGSRFSYNKELCKSLRENYKGLKEHLGPDSPNREEMIEKLMNREQLDIKRDILRDMLRHSKKLTDEKMRDGLEMKSIDILKDFKKTTF